MHDHFFFERRGGGGGGKRNNARQKRENAFTILLRGTDAMTSSYICAIKSNERRARRTQTHRQVGQSAPAALRASPGHTSRRLPTINIYRPLCRQPTVCVLSQARNSSPPKTMRKKKNHERSCPWSSDALRTIKKIYNPFWQRLCLYIFFLAREQSNTSYDILHKFAHSILTEKTPLLPTCIRLLIIKQLPND